MKEDKPNKSRQPKHPTKIIHETQPLEPVRAQVIYHIRLLNINFNSARLKWPKRIWHNSKLGSLFSMRIKNGDIKCNFQEHTVSNVKQHQET